MNILIMTTKLLIYVLVTEHVEKCIKSVNACKDFDHKADAKNLSLLHTIFGLFALVYKLLVSD